MATTYKTFLNNDVATTRTLLHEAIPLTGTIVSGTYTDSNVKNYNHGMFQSTHDYPYLSSSANHIFDITFGYANASNFSSSTAVQNSKKINIYNQMAQVLCGHDENGDIRNFDRDGDYTTTGIRSGMNECFFVNFARLLTKDEIKKGSFSLSLYPSGTSTKGTGSTDPLAGPLLTLADHGAASSFKVNSPAGEFGLLKRGATETEAFGHVYYQAGVAVISASVFGTGSHDHPDFGPRNPNFGFSMRQEHTQPYSASIKQYAQQGTISGAATAFRNRWHDCSFNNTTELNSTIYFCRVNHNEFNYSSNPTYVSSSKIRVKSESIDHPVSYITTIGLYSADNELLATAKLSEPLKNSPDTDLTVRVRLDY